MKFTYVLTFESDHVIKCPEQVNKFAHRDMNSVINCLGPALLNKFNVKINTYVEGVKLYD